MGNLRLVIGAGIIKEEYGKVKGITKAGGKVSLSTIPLAYA